MGKIEQGFVGLALVLSACSPAEPEPLGRAALPIKGGMDDSADTAVVAVTNKPAGSAITLCTGSLIAPNLVLTARHCVSSASAGNVDCALTKVSKPNDAKGFFVSTAQVLDPGNFGEHLVAQVLVLPGDDALLCGRDLAALVLEDSVTNAQPLAVRLDPDLLPADVYSAVGYGAVDGSGNGSGKRRRLDAQTVVCVGSTCMMIEVDAAEWLGSGGVCVGDSGGPALDDQGRVTGVTSRGAEDCGLTVYGSTIAWADWIRNLGMCAAGAGLYDPPAWTAGATATPEYCMPIGDSCAAPGDCGTGRCFTDGYCTRPCSDDLPCPDDYVCRDNGGEMVCVV